MLNQGLRFVDAPLEVQRAFRHGRAERVLLGPATRLYKLTDAPLVRRDGSVSPWWSSIEPLCPGDPGLSESERRALSTGTSFQEFVRARAAVTRQWNAMTRLVRIRLLTACVGFAGQSARQLMDQDPGLANVSYIGGAYQVWIPNLTRSHVDEIPG